MRVLGTDITEFLVLASQLDSPEDNLLVGPFFLLDYLDVIGLGPGRSTCLCMVKQLCYGVQIKPSFDPTQSVGHLVIGAFEVFDGHVVRLGLRPNGGPGHRDLVS